MDGTTATLEYPGERSYTAIACTSCTPKHERFAAKASAAD